MDHALFGAAGLDIGVGLGQEFLQLVGLDFEMDDLYDGHGGAAGWPSAPLVDAL